MAERRPTSLVQGTTTKEDRAAWIAGEVPQSFEPVIGLTLGVDNSLPANEKSLF